MKIKTINNIQIHYITNTMTGGLYMARLPGNRWLGRGLINLEEFTTLAGAERWCSSVRDYLKKKATP